MSELELKFQIPAASLDALRRAIARGPGPAADTQRLQATYIDTDDTLLGRHRMAWRLRREGDRWVQTLKAAVPHSIDRLEENVDRGPADTAGTVPALDQQAHRGTRAGDLLQGLLDAHPQARLGPRYTTDVSRLRRVVVRDGARIEIALDDGEIVAGERRARVCEIEFELVEGPPAALFALAADWQVAHGLWLDVASKAERGERLARGDAFGDAVRATPPRLERKLSVEAALRRVVAACLAQVLPGLGALAHGCREAEHVHQSRVGLRRLRTALRELGAGVPGVDASWEAPLADAFRALGRVRDDSALPAVFASRLASAGAPLAAWPVDPATTASIAAIALDPALQRVLLSVLAFAEGADAPAAAGTVKAGATRGASKDARRVFARRLSALHAALARSVDGFESAPTDEQHQARKRLKRLRYLAEFAAPLYGRRAVARYLEALEPAQDALGRLHDEVVAHERFLAAASRDPRALFAVGWFEGRRPAAVRLARRALRRVARAERFWR